MYARSGLGQTPGFSFVKVGGSPTQYPNFSVGDTWQITVTGPPTSPVWVGGSQNGVAFGTYQIGSTDASGTFTTTGTMGAANIGAWSEYWDVGGAPVGNTVYNGDQVASINFTVAAAPAPAGGGSGSGTAPTTKDPNGVTCDTSALVAGYCPGSAAPYVDPNLFNELITSQGLDIGSYDIPWWLVAAAVGGALFLFSGSKR
jgi:hypothetical protein